MKFETKGLLLAAALGLPVMLVGCRSRAELMTSTAVESPNRTVTSGEDDTSESEVAAGSARGDTAPSASVAQSTAQQSDARSDTVSLTTPSPESPQSILESAGAVLEFDEQGHAVGIDLTEARISATVTRSIAELGHLQWADLRGTSISDADLAVIGAAPQFELLALGKTRITDAGLRHLKQQTGLRFLSLDETAVTDKGLLVLAGLPRLEGVSLAGTSVSKAAARDFEERTPGCRVILDDKAPAGSGETPRSTPQEPAPGEPTSATDATWYLDETQTRPQPQPATFAQSAQPTLVSELSHSGHDTGKNLNEVLQRRLLDPEVLNALSQHLLAQHQYERAAKALEALSALQPDSRQVQFDLGVALARSGQYERAQPYLAAIVGEATAYYNLGVIAYEHDQPGQSERFFARAVEMAPNFAEARSWLSRVRNSTTVSPASHAPQAVDQADLVDLLMSEFGAAGAPAAPNQSGAGITIVPATRR